MITRIASHHVVDRDGSDSPVTIDRGWMRSDVARVLIPRPNSLISGFCRICRHSHCHGGAGADFTD